MRCVNQDEFIARSNLRLAGVLTELRNLWMKRLDSYYSELERLIAGEWLDASDLSALVKEARMASREAMDGLATDLSSELLHASTGIFQRHDAERQSMREEINDLRNKITRLMSGDVNTIRRENESLRAALLSLPEFQLLEILQNSKGVSYSDLAALADVKRSQITKLTKQLVKQGYARIDKTTRPHTVLFISAPWEIPRESFQEPIPTESITPNQIALNHT